MALVQNGYCFMCHSDQIFTNYKCMGCHKTAVKKANADAKTKVAMLRIKRSSGNKII